VADVTSLQSALTLEHAAVYGYGIVGGRLGPADALARDSYDVHRQRRDVLTAALVDTGATPTPAAAAYEPERPVLTDVQARSLATEIERQSAVAYAALVASGDGDWRRTGAGWLRDSAVRGYRWSSRVAPLPGLGPQQ